MLDAATLLVTTVEGGPQGAARMLWGIGVHLVEDLSRFFRLKGDEGPGVEHAEFDQARARLAGAGYRLKDAEESWAAFAKLRSSYAGSLNALARNWAVPPAQWIGDRSYMPHAAV